jgi:WD40 repeat protein
MSGPWLTPDGEILVTAARDGTLRSWDSAGQPRAEFHSLGPAVLTLAISPDSKTMATAGNGPVVRLWNVPTGQELFVVPSSLSATVRAVAFSPDGTALAVSGWQITGRGELWHYRAGSQEAQ